MAELLTTLADPNVFQAVLGLVMVLGSLVLGLVLAGSVDG